MAGAEPLELRLGISTRFLILQSGIAILGVAAILSSPATWVWKSCLLAALLVAAIAVHVGSMKACRFDSISLFADGTGLVTNGKGQASFVTVGNNAWITRWLCVLAVFEQDRGRQYHCVICASENDIDQFRRLLGYLRMRVTSTNAHKAIR